MKPQAVRLAASLNPVQRRRKRRELLLSMVAAVVILASFLVKDVLEERLTDRIDGFQSALAVFDQSHEFDSVLDKLEDVRKTAAYATPLAPDSVQLLSNRYVDWHSAWETYENKRLRFETLLGDAPWLDAPTIDALKKQVAQFKADTTRFAEQIEAYGHAISPGDPTHRASPKAIESQSTMLSRQGGKLFLENQQLQDALPKEARAEMATEGTRHRALRIASYLLFVLGWVLALAGKLFHIPGLAAE